MGTILGNATADNTRYTEFENNQVLTADQLNDLFNYLQVQERLTRARAIGVGIVGGLEIGLADAGQVVLSKGVALTTDGDLLHVDADQVFTQFAPYADDVAHYTWFRNGDALMTLYELLPARSQRVGASPMEAFAAVANNPLGNFVGVLYLEEHDHDPDTCTGVDCDNKGREVIRKLKVLLAPKDALLNLPASIPRINEDYFALADIKVPRVKVNPAIDKYGELTDAFKTAVNGYGEIKIRLAAAWEACKPVVADEFNTDDLPGEWNGLLDGHFNNTPTLYIQYLYDFVRDLAAAYNELRETLFGDTALLCPPIPLFPKHVLLGALRQATIIRPQRELPPANNIRLTAFDFIRSIRFDLADPIRRFRPALRSAPLRHDFYPSPALAAKEDVVERTRFQFARINALIRNFKVPASEDIPSVQGIRITPSLYADRSLGERSIPFYYQYNRGMPINAYWNLDANSRGREDELLYYFAAGTYGKQASVTAPLDFDIQPYTFFRVEGHIGFPYTEVERTLTGIIEANNLPINILTVQVERELRTIPTKPWFFPHIELYGKISHRNFLEQLQQADFVHPALQRQTADEPEADNINLSITNFNNARSKVINGADPLSSDFDTERFRKDVSDVVQASTEIKTQTRKFTFSNTAIPHDFVINTNVLSKAELIAGLYKDQLDKKKEEYLLGNFLRLNPGLEHAGGVLRGGTFVLVYSSNDNRVVADFMLPYASIDKDIVRQPPVIRPIQPLPPLVDLPKVFEKRPFYKQLIEERVKGIDDRFVTVDKKLGDWDDRIKQKINDFDQTRDLFKEQLKFIDDQAKGLDTRFAQKAADLDATRQLFDQQVAFFDSRIREVDQQFNGKFQDFDKKLDYQGRLIESYTKVGGTRGLDSGNLPGRNVVVGGVDLGREMDNIVKMRTEVETLQPGTPERKVKEEELTKLTTNLVGVINQPEVAIDKDVKAGVFKFLLDMKDVGGVVSNPRLNGQINRVVSEAMKNIIK